MTIYDATLGAILIGVLISGVLFGSFTWQVYTYHKSFPEESNWIRFGLVDGMWFLELAHTVCTFHLMYFYAVTHYGELEVLEFESTSPYSWPAAVLFHSMVAVLAQSYFTYRIARFGTYHPYIIPTICSILMFCELSGDTAIAAYVVKENLQSFLNVHEWLMISVLAIRTTASVIISVTLVSYLVRAKKNNAYKNTTAVIDKLILWSIETGAVMSMHGIVLLIFLFWNRFNCAQADTWLALYLILPKVFSNTMLANMNSRIGLRNMQSTIVISHGFEITFVNPAQDISGSSQLQGASSMHELHPRYYLDTSGAHAPGRDLYTETSETESTYSQKFESEVDWNDSGDPEKEDKEYRLAFYDTFNCAFVYGV
ncbi:hypothetical protein GYMLUDRAFT_245465 [Collybiopsis luxurians FD-317 M1]|uniref:DUF6534 domain-containing protein n=1 Tax=Collybiopsis luxurians FD-317 M1 TaxID=944289 RepID=A0A0D0C983_9AGAR|nr:hypothetical protein GYMLUDRAFT_245465 [Collybiopsis luxurians FD-317 M1]